MRVKDFFGKKLFIAVVILTVALTSGTGFCTPSKKVAVLPFTMNSPQDLGFLQNGLFSMLSSRLADAGKVDVLDRETVDAALAEAQKSDLTKGALTEDKARMIGANMGVDFILFGSLTHFGESVSLDAKMVDVTGEKETLAFFEQSNAMGDVIPLVNSFAGDINAKVFNRHIDNQLYVQPEPQQAPAPGGLQYAGGVAYNGGMMAMRPGQGFATHLKVNDIIRAMATGDVDKDGTLEVVAATDTKLLIYHMQGNMLALEKTLDYQSYLKIVGLDIADINGNGYPEIFVSAMTIHRTTLSSFIVEYNGSSYATLEDDQSYYYRVVDNGNGNPVLYAQDKGNDPFSGRIHLMSPANASYNEEKTVRMPRNTSVLSLARGPVRDENTSEFLSINLHNRLVAISDTGASEWESVDKYGKSNNYWLMPSKGEEESLRERVYFNPRVKFYPLGEDKKMKAFIVKNSEVGGGLVGRIKRFKDGHINVMTWNGIALAPVFQTATFPGWISDFDIADLDNDGKMELVISLVSTTKMSILSKDSDSNIISYKLE